MKKFKLKLDDFFNEKLNNQIEIFGGADPKELDDNVKDTGGGSNTTGNGGGDQNPNGNGTYSGGHSTLPELPLTP